MNDGRNGTVKQIICIKWGTKFGPEFVNRLHAMVARNITPPFRLYCFTDDGGGLHPDIAVRPLPEFDYQAPVNTRGKWPKSRLWAKADCPPCCNEFPFGSLGSKLRHAELVSA